MTPAEIAEAYDALATALQQWRLYYGVHNDSDIEDGEHMESQIYRRCFGVLKQLKEARDDN